jgi:phage recombination protein Bet
MGALALVDNAKSLDLIRRTVAKDCDAAEFDQFIHICRAVRLDPLRRQIYAFVFGKNNPQYRRMSVVTGIDGYRAIAERTGNYRPDTSPPRIEYNEGAKDQKTNPLGIVRCEVTVYKHAHGEWFPVTADAYWDEYAPIKDGALDPKKENWRKMARVMIAKCAEAQAIRRAWPDDFSGLEVEEETDRRASLDLSASELADEGAQKARFELIGGINCITVDWCDGEPLVREQVGAFGDKVLAFIAQHKTDDPDRIRLFQSRNTAALREYWAKDKSGALELKKAFEAV